MAADDPRRAVRTPLCRAFGPKLPRRWGPTTLGEGPPPILRSARSAEAAIAKVFAKIRQKILFCKFSGRAGRTPQRPRFSQTSTKALPQAFRRLIFRSGCSIFLFSKLKVVSFWVLLSACPVTAGRSKRFIQTFLSSGSCRQLHLEASSFFVHCTKAL